MNELNKWIIEIANREMSNQVADYFAILSFIPVVFFCIYYGRKLKTGIIKSIVLVAFVYVANYMLMLILTWIEMGFRFFGAQNGIRSFAYTPLVCWFGAKILRMQWSKANTIWAICLPFSHAVAHLGCVFAGCCDGYPCSWGVYNPVWDEYQFPVQIVESVVAIVVGMCVVCRIQKRKCVIDGKEYPIMLILFGSSRFICEFLRNNPKIWIGCSSLSFHALFMCVVGIVWLVIANRKEESCT